MISIGKLNSLWLALCEAQYHNGPNVYDRPNIIFVNNKTAIYLFSKMEESICRL